MSNLFGKWTFREVATVSRPTPPELPEPWFYRPEVRRRLWPAARVMRNIALTVGYYAGLVFLAGGVIALFMAVAAPAASRLVAFRYPLVPVGVGGGLLAGVLTAAIYRARAPHNHKAPKVVVPLLTGLGGLCGVGYALGGDLGGQIALLFCLLGVAAFLYVEAAPPDQ
jgi:hypothetical protein